MSAGKGDTPRPVDGGKYRENYDRIFHKIGKREDLSRVVTEFGSKQFYAGADAAMRRFGIVRKP